jgi:hypothetical protein
MTLSACSKPLLPLAPNYPADLLQTCDPLPAFDGQTTDDLVGYTLNLTGLYGDCSSRHAGLSEAVKP